jgi:membrane-bound metal-dependent hydrolase YbcI (DUF457 family)
MPFPIAHGLVAASLFTALQKKFSLARDWKMMLLCAALAIAPDTDFILKWFYDLRHAHRGFSHSIAVGIMVGLVASALVGARTVRTRLVLLLVPVSHGLLDVLVTSREGAGTQLLWPLSDRRLKLEVFDYFSFRYDPRIDDLGVMLGHAFKVSLFELVVIGPLFTLLLLFKLRNRR